MRAKLPALAALVLVLVTTVFLGSRLAVVSHSLRDLRRQCEELQTRVEANERTIGELRAAIEYWPASGPLAAPAASADAAIARRLADMTLAQSNTLALIEKLVTGKAEPPAITPQQRQATIASLEQALTDMQQKFDTARQKTHELVLNLAVPPEVSAMEPGRAVDVANLRPYWPYFDAKRERESLAYMLDRLRVRLEQERMEAKLHSGREAGQ